MAFAPTIGWLLLSRLIAGMMGASFTTASAYIADVSPPERRAQNFGMIGAVFGLGFIVGPLLGGMLGGYGARVPFIFSAVLTLVNWLYGFFVLPESLPAASRRPFSWKRANPIGSLVEDLPAIAAICRRFPDLIVLSDEIYSRILFGGRHASLAAQLGMREKTVILNGFSKTYY